MVRLRGMNLVRSCSVCATVCGSRYSCVRVPKILSFRGGRPPAGTGTGSGDAAASALGGFMIAETLRLTDCGRGVERDTCALRCR